VIPPEVLSSVPGAVVFWSGAGVSNNAPSNGRLGEELSRRVLVWSFAEGLLDRMQRAYARLEVNRSLSWLETLLDVAVAEQFPSPGIRRSPSLVGTVTVNGLLSRSAGEDESEHGFHGRDQALNNYRIHGMTLMFDALNC